MLIILFLVVGSVASVLVGLLLTEPLMARGSRSLGFWAGLLALIIMFGAGQYYWAHYYRSTFSRSGPCETCCELCGLTFLFWWTSWGIGFIVYLVISAKLYKQYSQITPLPTPRWLKIGVLLGIFCVIVGVIGFSLLGDNLERTNLRHNIAKIESSVLSGNLTKIGSIQLAQSADYWTFGNVSYVTGIGISPDGEWLSLQFRDKIELWNISDITRRKVFHSESHMWDWDRFSFSPDSSKYAVWMEGKLSVYALGEGIRLAWEIENRPYDLGFSKDGRELVITNDQGVETYDANNGKHLETVTLPGKNGFTVNQLSDDSEYIVTNSQQVLQLYNRHDGQLLYEIELSSLSMILLPNNGVLFVDCAQSTAEVWNKETGYEGSFDVVSDYCGSFYHFTPDSHTAVEAGWRNFSLLDLKNKVRIDSIPIQLAITAIAISPDGRMIIVATADGRLNFYANIMAEN